MSQQETTDRKRSRSEDEEPEQSLPTTSDIKKEETQLSYVDEFIRECCKTYNCPLNEVPEEIIKEARIINSFTSGCHFAELVNYRFYAFIALRGFEKDIEFPEIACWEDIGREPWTP